MSYARMDHAAWIETSIKVTCSPLGRKAAYILGVTFGGIYNVPMNHKKTKWADERFVQAVVSLRSMATFDFDELTKLTLLAHALCVRAQIEAVAPSRIKLSFSPRVREGAIYARHPDIETAVRDFNEWFDAAARQIAEAPPTAIKL